MGISPLRSADGLLSHFKHGSFLLVLGDDAVCADLPFVLSELAHGVLPEFKIAVARVGATATAGDMDHRCVVCKKTNT